MKVITTASFLVTASVMTIVFATPSFAMSDIKKAKATVRAMEAGDLALATRYLDPQKFTYHNPRTNGGLEGEHRSLVNDGVSTA